MLYILPIFFGLGLSQAHIHTSCESMEYATSLQSTNMYESTATIALGYNTSNTRSWTAILNSWTMMPSMGPSPPITTSSTARTSSSTMSSSTIMPTLPPGTSVEAIIEIHIGNLSGTAPIDLTNANATSTSLILESQSMSMLPTSMANPNGTSGFSASRLFPTPTAALGVFTGAGASVNYNNVFPFLLLQITVIYLM